MALRKALNTDSCDVPLLPTSTVRQVTTWATTVAASSHTHITGRLLCWWQNQHCRQLPHVLLFFYHSHKPFSLSSQLALKPFSKVGPSCSKYQLQPMTWTPKSLSSAINALITWSTITILQSSILELNPLTFAVSFFHLKLNLTYWSSRFPVTRKGQRNSS